MEQGEAVKPVAVELVTPVAADPVARIQKMMDAEKAPPAQAKPGAKPRQEAVAAQQPQTEQAEATQEANPEEEAAPGPNKQEEGDDAPAEDARRVAEIPLDQLEAIELEVTVKGEDGKDIAEKQTIKSLREGYMRQKDYQRKTAEVARQREESGEKIRQAIDSERSSYSTSLQQMQALLIETVAPELKDVNWNDLAANNAFEYVRLRNRADQISQALSAIQGKQKEMTVKQQADQKEATQKAASKAREQLQADIPGWNDARYQSLMMSGEKYGYKPEEIATWVDARAIKLLNDAYEYQKLKTSPTGKPSADKKVIVAPKVVKPGAAAEQTQAQQRHSAAMKQLRNNGSIEDAAAVIRARMG